MKYEMSGQLNPVLMCTLKEGESLLTTGRESCWNSESVKCSVVAGELVKVKYTLEGKKGSIVFAPSFPGHIKGAEIRKDRTVVVREDSFIAAQDGVKIEPYIKLNIQGKDVVMYKLSGEGMAFYEIKGSSVEYQLGAGQGIDTNLDLLVSMEETCSIEYKDDASGSSHAVVRGPGKIFLQSMCMNQFAEMLKPYLV